jgi:hypothetical protein
MVPLAPLSGLEHSEAPFVNNSGQIVGYSFNTSFDPDARHATMWDLSTVSPDVTPPALFVPETIMEDGTSPAGAIVTCAVSATFDVIVEDATQWTFCAPEGGVCAFSGTTQVRYGVNGAFVFKTLTDGTACTNDVFGDPIFGTVKECAIPTTIPCPNEVFGDPIYGVVKRCDLRSAQDPTAALASTTVVGREWVARAGVVTALGVGNSCGSSVSNASRGAPNVTGEQQLDMRICESPWDAKSRIT